MLTPARKIPTPAKAARDAFKTNGSDSPQGPVAGRCHHHKPSADSLQAWVETAVDGMYGSDLARSAFGAPSSLHTIDT